MKIIKMALFKADYPDDTYHNILQFAKKAGIGMENTEAGADNFASIHGVAHYVDVRFPYQACCKILGPNVNITYSCFPKMVCTRATGASNLPTRHAVLLSKEDLDAWQIMQDNVLQKISGGHFNLTAEEVSE